MIFFATKLPLPAAGWRWVLHTERGRGIGWSMQSWDRKAQEWHFLHTHYYLLTITPHWYWGRHHAYYDGPHDSFDLGFIHFCWSGRWCEKCVDEA